MLHNDILNKTKTVVLVYKIYQGTCFDNVDHMKLRDMGFLYGMIVSFKFIFT